MSSAHAPQFLLSLLLVLLASSPASSESQIPSSTCNGTITAAEDSPASSPIPLQDSVGGIFEAPPQRFYGDPLSGIREEEDSTEASSQEEGISIPIPISILDQDSTGGIGQEDSAYSSIEDRADVTGPELNFRPDPEPAGTRPIIMDVGKFPSRDANGTTGAGFRKVPRAGKGVRTIPSILRGASCFRSARRPVQFWTRSALKTAAGVELSSWRTYAAVVCGALAATLSSAGGVGGGGLYVPIFNLLLGFNSKTSAALSSCMILGGILVNILWYSFQRKPGHAGNKPLIDYQIALLFLPNVLLGISAGVICNVMSPGWLVTATLIVVLFVMTFRSCRSAAIRWQKESEGLNDVRKIGIPADKNSSGEGHNGNQNGHADHVEDARQQGQHNPDNVDDLEQPLLDVPARATPTKKYKQFPPVELTLLMVVWIVFLAIQLLRGSSDGQNLFGIEQCGLVYWIITSSQIPIAAVVTSVTILYLRKSSLQSKSDDEDDDPSDDDLRQYVVDVKSMVVTAGFALGAGFLGGMLGLGGGTIISPLLIEMGMHPQVTAATCSYVVFFSASLSVVQYWLLGRIPEVYALASATLSLIFSVIGLQLVQTFIIRYGRVSLIVFSVSTVMGISAVLMAGFGSWDAWIALKEGDYMGFEMPC